MRDRPGHYNPEMCGLDAFRAALQRQEGQFMRGASYIMNPPKDLKVTEGGDTNNQRLAGALLGRDAKGRSVKKEGGSGASST